MIGKIPRAGRGFRGLVNYLLYGSRRSGSAMSRPAWTSTNNLIIDDPDQVPDLMRMTAAKSVRVVRPVYHFVISWHASERPTPDAMRKVADRACRDLSLDEHQQLFIAHHDTRHPHVHVVVNRVHPETGVAWSTSHDYRRLEQSIARQASEMGFVRVPGRHNARHDGATLPRRARDGAYQRARRVGSLPARSRWPDSRIEALRPMLRPLFERSQSWAELTGGLAARHLDLIPKGQGLVIADTNGEMKLSDLGAGIRRATLEQRFGQGWVEYDRTRAAPSNGPPSPSRRRRHQLTR